jgi:hypothetical protein
MPARWKVLKLSLINSVQAEEELNQLEASGWKVKAIRISPETDEIHGWAHIFARKSARNLEMAELITHATMGEDPEGL